MAINCKMLDYTDGKPGEALASTKADDGKWYHVDEVHLNVRGTTLIVKQSPDKDSFLISGMSDWDNEGVDRLARLCAFDPVKGNSEEDSVVVEDSLCIEVYI